MFDILLNFLVIERVSRRWLIEPDEEAVAGINYCPHPDANAALSDHIQYSLAYMKYAVMSLLREIPRNIRWRNSSGLLRLSGGRFQVADSK